MHSMSSTHTHPRVREKKENERPEKWSVRETEASHREVHEDERERLMGWSGGKGTETRMRGRGWGRESQHRHDSWIPVVRSELRIDMKNNDQTGRKGTKTTMMTRTMQEREKEISLWEMVVLHSVRAFREARTSGLEESAGDPQSYNSNEREKKANRYSAIDYGSFP